MFGRAGASCLPEARFAPLGGERSLGGVRSSLLVACMDEACGLELMAWLVATGDGPRIGDLVHTGGDFKSRFVGEDEDSSRLGTVRRLRNGIVPH